MKFLLDITLTDEGKEADPIKVADDLLDILCATDDDGEGFIQSFDGCDPVPED